MMVRPDIRAVGSPAYLHSAFEISPRTIVQTPRATSVTVELVSSVIHTRGVPSKGPTYLVQQALTNKAQAAK